MIESKKSYLCDLLKIDCIKLIHSKNVSIGDLAFELGISQQELVRVFASDCDDYTIYLRAYNILLER